MVTWKLVEPLLTPHRRYPDRMTSPFVWKSIASTLPAYLQVPSLGLLDRLRQQSQLARGKNLIKGQTIPNVNLFVCCCCCCCFYSWRKERVERFRLFNVKALFFVRCITYVLCQGELTQLIGSEGSRYDILALQTRSSLQEQIFCGPYWRNVILPRCWRRTGT